MTKFDERAEHWRNLPRTAVRDVELSDPDKMTPRAQELASRMKDMSVDDFNDQVLLWATTEKIDRNLELALIHPEVVIRTNKALSQLIREAQDELAKVQAERLEGFLPRQQYEENRLQIIDLETTIKQLGGARKLVKPIVNEAISNRKRSAVEDRALRILRQVRYAEYMAIIADLNKGLSVDEATANAERRPDQVRYRNRQTAREAEEGAPLIERPGRRPNGGRGGARGGGRGDGRGRR